MSIDTLLDQSLQQTGKLLEVADQSLETLQELSRRVEPLRGSLESSTDQVLEEVKGASRRLEALETEWATVFSELDTRAADHQSRLDAMSNELVSGLVDYQRLAETLRAAARVEIESVKAQVSRCADQLLQLQSTAEEQVRGVEESAAFYRKELAGFKSLAEESTARVGRCLEELEAGFAGTLSYLEGQVSRLDDAFEGVLVAVEEQLDGLEAKVEEMRDLADVSLRMMLVDQLAPQILRMSQDLEGLVTASATATIDLNSQLTVAIDQVTARLDDPLTPAVKELAKIHDYAADAGLV